MSRGRQIVRQWCLLKVLEGARRGLSVEELHDSVDDDCSKRTIYRDLEQLSAAGFPLVEGKSGWRMLETGEGAWSVPLHPTDLLALSVARSLLEPVQGSWLHASLAELHRRLMAVLTPVGRKYVEELAKSAIGTLSGAGEYGEASQVLDDILAAIEKQHLLEVEYHAPNKPVRLRRVEPYTLWYADGRVYLIAWCREADDVRTFAVQRIGGAEVLDEPFEPRADFDAVAFSRKGFGVYHGPVHRYAIDFEPEVAYLVRERRWHQTQVVTDRPGGGARLEMEAAGLPEVAAWVAGFGGRARARRPKELVDRVAEIHRAGLHAHCQMGS